MEQNSASPLTTSMETTVVLGDLKPIFVANLLLRNQLEWLNTYEAAVRAYNALTEHVREVVAATNRYIADQREQRSKSRIRRLLRSLPLLRLVEVDRKYKGYPSESPLDPSLWAFLVECSSGDSSARACKDRLRGCENRMFASKLGDKEKQAQFKLYERSFLVAVEELRRVSSPSTHYDENKPPFQFLEGGTFVGLLVDDLLGLVDSSYTRTRLAAVSDANEYMIAVRRQQCRDYLRLLEICGYAHIDVVVGQPFDSTFMEPYELAPSENSDQNGTVAEEMFPGFKERDGGVFRKAKVTVFASDQRP